MKRYNLSTRDPDKVRHLSAGTRQYPLPPAVKPAEPPVTDERRALDLFLQFLASLPEGWLAHTSDDVGLLNDAYLAARKAGVPIPSKYHP